MSRRPATSRRGAVPAGSRRIGSICIGSICIGSVCMFGVLGLAGCATGGTEQSRSAAGSSADPMAVTTTTITSATTPAPTTAAPTTAAPTTATAATASTVTTIPAPVTTPTSASVEVVDGGGAVEVSPYLSAFCPDTPRAVAVDRDRQRAWLCDEGVAVHEFAFTGAITQPDAGTYPVFAKDLAASSTIGGSRSTMTHFVAFTRGEYQGARIAFHSLPVDADGTYLQPPESVGDPAFRGASAGCLRLLPDDAVRVWEWLSVGDEVRIIN